MKRPVRITNITSRKHAAKLFRTLKADFPGWHVRKWRQTETTFAVSATPPGATDLREEATDASPCPLGPPPTWPDRNSPPNRIVKRAPTILWVDQIQADHEIR